MMFVDKVTRLCESSRPQLYLRAWDLFSRPSRVVILYIYIYIYVGAIYFIYCTVGSELSSGKRFSSVDSCDLMRIRMRHTMESKSPALQQALQTEEVTASTS